VTAERILDPQLAAILAEVEAGGMFDEGIGFAEIRARFELTAPMMWNPANLPVRATEDHEIPSPGGAIPVRVYTPTPAPAVLPVLVYFHGGGFVGGSIATADAMTRYLARDAECIVVSVGFRLAPENPFPASIDDCFAALGWAAANAESLGGDAARLAVGGDASGGTFAAVCAQLARDAGKPSLRFQLLLGPATDLANRHPSRDEFADDPLVPARMVEMVLDAYAPPGTDRSDPRCSPLAGDPRGLPPTYILASEYDFLRDEERAYADALRDAGVDVTYRCWPGTTHNFFSMHDHLDVARAAMAEAAGALRAALRRR
ncbi:MAG: alpha/beta hydrolase, partial [Candidatus Binatia bacterium]